MSNNEEYQWDKTAHYCMGLNDGTYFRANYVEEGLPEFKALDRKYQFANTTDYKNGFRAGFQGEWNNGTALQPPLWWHCWRSKCCQ